MHLLIELKIIFTKNKKLIAVGTQKHCDHPFIRSSIICIDTTGNMEWSWNDCYLDYETEEAYVNLTSVIESDNGSIYAVGHTTTYNALYQGLAVKFRTNGEIVFRKTFGLPNFQAAFTDIGIISEKHFAISGWIADKDGEIEDKQSLFIFDTAFNALYQNNMFIGGGGGPQKIAIADDTSIYVLGSTIPSWILPETTFNTDLLLIKYNSFGELIWKKFIGGENEYYFQNQFCIVSDADHGFTFGCNFNLEDTEDSFFTALYKLDSMGNGIFTESDFPYPDSSEYIIYNTDKPINSTNNVNIYPNPAKNEFVIETQNNFNNSEILLFDITGKIVFQTQPRDNQTTINTEHLPSGVYVIKTITNGEVRTNKIIINH